MKYFVLTFFIVFQLHSFANLTSGVYVKLIKGNCQTCSVNSAQILETIIENNYFLVLPESNNSYFKSTFSNIDASAIYYSDSLFEYMNSSIPSAILICNKRNISEVKLKDFHDISDIKLWKLFPCIKEKKVLVELSLPTSNQLKFKKLDETFIIKDFATKTLYCFNKDIQYKINYSSLNLDSIVKSKYSQSKYKIYHEGDSVMKAHNIKNNGSFGNFHMENDTLFVLSTIQTYTKPKETFEIYRDVVIFKYFNKSLAGVVWINEKKGKTEQISEHAGFFIKNNLVYTQVVVKKLKKRSKILKIYRINGEECEYIRNVDFYPNEKMIDDFGSDFFTYKSQSNNGVFSFSFYNRIFDANSSSTFEMPFAFTDNKFLSDNNNINQIHFDCITNISFYISLVSDNNTLKLYTRNRDNSIIHEEIVKEAIGSNNIYLLQKDGIYILNYRKQIISKISF
jgi:hypothetical protein